jgi:hypothetical protein
MSAGADGVIAMRKALANVERLYAPGHLTWIRTWLERVKRMPGANRLRSLVFERSTPVPHPSNTPTTMKALNCLNTEIRGETSRRPSKSWDLNYLKCATPAPSLPCGMTMATWSSGKRRPRLLFVGERQGSVSSIVCSLSYTDRSGCASEIAGDNFTAFP